MSRRRVIAAVAALAVAAGSGYGIDRALTRKTTPYEVAIAYVTSRPAFTPRRTIDVSDASAFKGALSTCAPATT